MNSDTLAGTATDLGGQAKQAVGDATGDTSLQTQGAADQISGSIQKGIGQARDAAGPLIEKGKDFAKQRPWAAAALAGVLGMALINTLRGKR